MTQLPSQDFEKFLKANVSTTQLAASVALLNWLETATTREEFLLFIEGVDRNKAFTVPCLNLLVRLHPEHPALAKAVEFNIIQRKNNG
jgi:hypothetical protein